MDPAIIAPPMNPDRLAETQRLFGEKMPPILKVMMEKLVNMPELRRLCEHAYSQSALRPFGDLILEALGVTYQLSAEDRKRIPRNGPLLVVANHPFGAIEGLVLGSVLRSVRADVKILANSFLGTIPELRELFICVDAFGGQEATHRNFQPLRSAMRWLDHGGTLAAFPAGEVSHVNLQHAAITDPEWKDTTARIARKLGVPVLPVFFCGNNSLMFQMLGMVNSKVRTALLAREMLNKRDQLVEVRIGNLIPSERLREFNSTKASVEYLRKKTYLLEHRDKKELESSNTVQSNNTATVPIPVGLPENSGVLENEILELEPNDILIEQGNFRVVHANAWEIPKTLCEIGRLRELAFRAVGEGTGRALDLDLFDEHYQHIILWDKKKREVAGAYRIGRTDHILSKQGVAGLYVNSLFRLRRSFFNRLGPALELGRSFIRIENQRDSRSLPLLWTGIARYVSRHPRYRYLFGPVSISSNYRPISRQLITWFLRNNHPGEMGLFEVAPMKPPSYRGSMARIARAYCEDVHNLDELSELIADIEPDSKGVPVLLRHYIRLGAKVLAFNVDPDFGNCLDALVMVDLAKVNDRILERLMGKSASIYFRLWHDAGPRESPNKKLGSIRADPPGFAANFAAETAGHGIASSAQKVV
jgi:putative hemolysin